jgi:hypothetical protein
MQSPALKLDIEFEILDLLEEARSQRLAGGPNPRELADLLVELLDCASRAKEVGFPFSAQKLAAAAKELGRLRPAGNTPPVLGKSA